MASRVAGQCSCRVTTVVTASGGGWKDEACAMADRTCRNLTVPIRPRKAAMAVSIRIIRFFMWYPCPRSGGALPHWKDEWGAPRSTAPAGSPAGGGSPMACYRLDGAVLNYDP